MPPSSSMPRPSQLGCLCPLSSVVSLSSGCPCPYPPQFWDPLTSMSLPLSLAMDQDSAVEIGHTSPRGPGVTLDVHCQAPGGPVS